jgi:hypothetical protein
MRALIYKPAQSAMQAGTGFKDKWVLEFEQLTPSEIEEVMGWTSSSDMKQQLDLRFTTKYDAEDYAKRNNIEYRIIESKKRTVKPKVYAENFQ